MRQHRIDSTSFGKEPSEWHNASPCCLSLSEQYMARNEHRDVLIVAEKAAKQCIYTFGDNKTEPADKITGVWHPTEIEKRVVSVLAAMQEQNEKLQTELDEANRVISDYESHRDDE